MCAWRLLADKDKEGESAGWSKMVGPSGHTLGYRKIRNLGGCHEERFLA